MYFCAHWADELPSVAILDGRIDTTAVADYWDTIEVGAYPDAFKAARNCDYHQLAQLLPRLCHTTV